MCIVMFIVTCKEKPVDNIKPAAAPLIDQCEGGQSHKHYYAVYTGKFFNGSSGTNEFDSCTFMGKKMKYYKNSIAPSDNGKEIKVYYKVLGNDTIIIPINPELDRYHNPSEVSPIALAIVLKGDYGCIPNFTPTNNKNMLFFEEDKKKYLNLHIALHDSINQQDHTVAVLQNYKFYISDDNFKKLDSTYKVKPYIQGGICKSDTTTMNIFDRDDSLLFSVSK